MKQSVVILGSTGSIGVQALEIIESNPERFEVLAITAAGNSPDVIIAQARKFNIKTIGVLKNADVIRAALPGADVIDGADASTEIAAMKCDVVLNAITGSIGLAPTLAALTAGNRLALANKESLVAGGELVKAIAKPNQLLPVDSEHSAIWQCLSGEKFTDVSKLVLTASGGPFRDRADLSTVTLPEALAHPTWSMGPVVTINSSTLMNKGLEIIEAHYLFDLPYSQIEAVIHPQSVVHSMVEYLDGSTIAQASPPNMKGPIALALAYPDRVPAATSAVDWSKAHTWTFAPIDEKKFPAIALARKVGELGRGFPAIFNAANEVAVQAFIDGAIGYTRITQVVEEAISTHDGAHAITSLSDVSAIEDDARRTASDYVKRISK